MKKLALVTFSLFLISILGLSFNIPLIKADPETIYVDDDNITGPWDGTPEHPYQNITSGLSHALSGDTIFVYNGTYIERLIINKPISLTGQNKHSTIIDGNRTGTVIEVTANNISITEFTIKNSGLFHYKLCGIYVEKISNSNISHNIVTYNYKGIHFVNSSHNIFTGNEISKNLEAIYMTNSNVSIFTKNTFSNNEFAIVATSSSNNTAFHNNFINNTHFISSINSANYWDNGMEGNYWSDYTGKDENQDGIGESPYIIDANNQDNHPLMGTFSDFTVIYEKETHHVFTICNSTISQFQFNETLRMLNFNVAGVNNTTGFCRITIPEQITHKPHIVLIDEQEVNATLLPISNATHTFLYFAYNHTTQEVKILSKPYYELLEKYDTLLEDYRNLNSTYYQLKDEFSNLNQTYWDLIGDYNNLNQTYEEVLSNYAKLTVEYNSLNQTYQELMANNTKLQNDYSSLQTDHNNLLEQYNSLNSTYNKTESEYTNTRITLWCISVVAAAITVITSSFTIKCQRKSKEQKKLIEKYKTELERISLLEIARKQFKTDVQRRGEKIEKFEKKYGVTVRPHNTLEDVIRSLELKKKKKD